MSLDPQDLAQELLRQEVTEVVAYDKTTGNPVEGPRPLEKFLENAGDPGGLADMARTGDPNDPQVQQENARRRAEFETLYQAVKSLARTGRTDRAALQNGEALLTEMIAGAAHIRDRTRKLFDASHPEVVESIERVAKKQKLSREEAFKQVMRTGYEVHIGYDNVRQALEVMREGVREINEALNRQPPSTFRA